MAADATDTSNLDTPQGNEDARSANRASSTHSRESGTESVHLLPLLRHDPLLDKSAGGGTFTKSQEKSEKESERGDSEDAAIAEPFERGHSPEADFRTRLRDVPAEEVSASADPNRESTRDQARHRMNKFSLYETASRFYLVGGDATERSFRILKIDRNADEEGGELSITDDKLVYTQKEMHDLLDTIEDGNRGTGGMKLRCTTWGLLGFIRFTGPCYMLLITKKTTVAMIGGHYVYQVAGTDLIPLTPAKSKVDLRQAEEARYLTILHNLDLTRSFYFSYSYNITRALQYNIIKERMALANGTLGLEDEDFNPMFVWNSHLLKPAFDAIKQPLDWCRPIIHGHVEQATVSTYGRSAFLTLIARRSQYFAGARFLKRGANDLGYVANDVETEQIVSEALTTSFHGPGRKLYTNPGWTSYVQHRGSIPLYWTQDNTGVTPKPPIHLNFIDPFYSAAALHFDDLFERYGAPIYVLNLVKAKERQPRESKLLDEYRKATTYLNQTLPQGKKIIHKHMDMSRIDKTPGQDVIRMLDDIADDILAATSFFHNGDSAVNDTSVQNGVARTNCIDCLDRTNAAQFVIGKRALGHQLHALGILEDKAVDFDTDAVNLLTHMYHTHGDTIAVQYGGSQLVNTMETYRKTNQWTSHSRDMIESFKRYYTNSFVDAQRQEAYNLFLGNYIYADGQPMLWDLVSDAHLHHTDPRTFVGRKRRSYVKWYDPAHLKERTLPGVPSEKALGPVSGFDDYWLEYYRPLTLSSLQKTFAYKMNTTFKYSLVKHTTGASHDDLSPFRVRHGSHHHDQERRKQVKDNLRLDSLHPDDDDASIMSAPASLAPDRQTTNLHRLVHAHEPLAKVETKADKTKREQQTFTQLVHNSLHPSVATQEAADYIEYVEQSQNLPLVVNSDDNPAIFEYGDANGEYLHYLNSANLDDDLALLGGDENLALYMASLTVPSDPLTVRDEDVLKKRYKAYGKWLRGKSLFKQLPID